jgi:hypothetical protein
MFRDNLEHLNAIRAEWLGARDMAVDPFPRPTMEHPEGPQPADAVALGRSTRMLVCAVDCTNSLLAEVEAYVQAGIAPATKRAYRADLDHFRAWDGAIPATDAKVAAYLADHAAVLKVSTLTRRLASVSIAHDARST